MTGEASVRDAPACLTATSAGHASVTPLSFAAWFMSGETAVPVAAAASPACYLGGGAEGSGAVADDIREVMSAGLGQPGRRWFEREAGRR